MKAKDAVIVVALLALAAVSYVLGYRNGQLRDVEMREARARLGMSLHLYQVAEQGDLEKLRRDLGMVILGQTRTFERQFGDPAGTNAFVQRFQRAQAIAAQVESQLVPVSSILTNFPHTPDAKVTVGGER